MSTTTPSPAPTRAHDELGWTEFVLGSIGYLVIGGVIGGVIGIGAWDLDGTPLAIAALLFTALVTFAAAAAALAVRVRSLAPLRLRNPGPRWLLTGFGAGLALVVVGIAIAAAWVALTGDTTNPQQNYAAAAARGGWGLVAVLVLGGLVIPLAEEILFRGVLYTALRRYGVLVAALGSAAVFGLFHVFPPLMLFAFLVGVVSAVLFERSKSIWPSVTLHVTCNVLGFLAAVILA